MSRSLLIALTLLSASCASSPPALSPSAPAPVVPAPSPRETATVAAPPPSLALSPDLGAWVDEYLSSYGKGWGDVAAMSGYVLVARDGKPVFGKGYGKANRATGAVVDGDTRFRIASVTKTFTAVAILQLVESGALRLDDPIGKYVPGLSAGGRVTIHHLLSHTSGIPNYTDDDALMKEPSKPHAQAKIVDAFASKPLLFEPGADYRYSNSDYFLLGMAMEKVTGRSYADVMQARVFAPAGMTRTSAMDTRVWPNSAVGYSTNDQEVVPSTVADLSLPFAAGSMISTANDLVRFDRALAAGTLLSAESMRLRVRPVKGGCAYGVGVGTPIGNWAVEDHSGGIEGFKSDFERIPQESLAIVVLANYDQLDTDEVLFAVREMVLTGKKVAGHVEPKQMPFDAPTLARYTGQYTLDEDSVKEWKGKVSDASFASLRSMALVNRAGHLRTSEPTQEVFLGADGALFAKFGGVTFVPDASEFAGTGVVHRLTMKQGDAAWHYTRVAAKK